MNKLLEKRLKTYKLQEYVKKILADESITLCYSKKRGMYERPGGCGYTDYIYQAGVFPKAEACKWTLDSHGEITITPVDIVKHNEYINDKISELKGNLIPVPGQEECKHPYTINQDNGTIYCGACMEVIYSPPSND
jgi:hypothetical protein